MNNMKRLSLRGGDSSSDQPTFLPIGHDSDVRLAPGTNGRSSLLILPEIDTLDDRGRASRVAGYLLEGRSGLLNLAFLP